MSDLQLVAEGLEFFLVRGNSPLYGGLAFRLPRHRCISNENDEAVNSRALLFQEAALDSHARVYGIASPLVRHLHTGDDGFDFLVSEYVIHDGSLPDSRQFGQLLRAIHDMPLPDIRYKLSYAVR